MSHFIRLLVVLLSLAAGRSVAPASAQTVSEDNGGQIVFVSDRDGNPEIYLMNTDSSNPQNLTHHPAQDLDPVWSPDGSQIAFSSDREDGNTEIYVMNADGSNAQRLTNSPGDDYNPTWSPDGTRLAFVSARGGNQQIYVMNTDGSDVRRLTNNRAGDYWPSW